MEKNNEREYADFQRRLRFSNLLSLAGDSLVEVFIYGGIHIEGRILYHSVDDEQASLLVDCEGFVMMLDVGNITHIEYVPDTDRLTLQVTERVSERFQPIIKPSEAADYVADMLLDEAQQAAEDKHTVVPGCLCRNCMDDDLANARPLEDVLAEMDGEDENEETLWMAEPVFFDDYDAKDDIDSGYVE